MKSMMRKSMGTVVDVALGSAMIGAVGGSGMSEPYKSTTQSMIGIGVMGRTAKRWLK